MLVDLSQIPPPSVDSVVEDFPRVPGVRLHWFKPQYLDDRPVMGREAVTQLAIPRLSSNDHLSSLLLNGGKATLAPVGTEATGEKAHRFFEVGLNSDGSRDLFIYGRVMVEGWDETYFPCLWSKLEQPFIDLLRSRPSETINAAKAVLARLSGQAETVLRNAHIVAARVAGRH